MKKLLFLILFISLSFLGHSQYNITQNLGGPTTLVQNPNYGGFRGGLIPYTFSDTTSANGLATSLKLYNGALIYCTADNAVYWRDATNQKWVQLLPSGGTGGLSAWLTTGNFAVPTDVNGYAKFGTFGTNGINVITSGNTVFKIHADGIVPDTGTVQGLGVNSYGELSYFSGGGGSTPTWQQTLTAGSTLTGDNTVAMGGFKLNFNNGLVGVGVSPTYKFDVLGTSDYVARVVGNSGGGLILGQFPSSSTFGGLWSANVSPSGTNYALSSSGSSTILNSTSTLDLAIGSTSSLRVSSTGRIGIGTTAPTQLLSLGTSGSTSGIFNAAGSTSGTITFQPQSAAGTYNWNWPTTAGTSGYLLTSGGGGSTAMTWTNPSSLGFANTALSNLASVAINTSLLPGANNTIDLGSSSFAFRTAYLGTSIFSPIVYGGSSSGGNLTIQSTSNGTKGKIFFGATSYVDEANTKNYLTGTTDMGGTAYGDGSVILSLNNQIGAGTILGAYTSGAARFSIDQNGNTKQENGSLIGSASGTRDASSILEVRGTTGGVLMPRMTATQASAISSPADGLIVYVTDTNGTFTAIGFWGRVSGAWTQL